MIISLTRCHRFLCAAVDRECDKSVPNEQMSDLVSVGSEDQISGRVQQDVILDRFVDVSGSNELQFDHVVTGNRQNVSMEKEISADDVIGRQIA